MTSTGITLVKNDGSETFTLKVTNVKVQVSNNVIIKSILSAVGGLAGANPVLSKEAYQLSVVIKDMDASDYPNSGTYSVTPNTHAYGQHNELLRVAAEWGPTQADGLDTLNYDGRSISGVISDLQLSEDRTSDNQRQYTGTLEFTHFDVYIG